MTTLRIFSPRLPSLEDTRAYKLTRLRERAFPLLGHLLKRFTFFSQSIARGLIRKYNVDRFTSENRAIQLANALPLLSNN
jgi:hypothetical protein